MTIRVRKVEVGATVLWLSETLLWPDDVLPRECGVLNADM